MLKPKKDSLKTYRGIQYYRFDEIENQFTEVKKRSPDMIYRGVKNRKPIATLFNYKPTNHLVPC